MDSVESIQYDSDCVHVSNGPKLTGTSSLSEEGGGVTAVGEGEGALLNSEISDGVEARTPVDSELSPAEGGEVDAVWEGGEVGTAASIVKEGDFTAELSENDSILGDNLEENKEVSMEEEPPSLDIPASDVKRNEGQHVDKISQGIMLGQNTDSEKENVDFIEEDTIAQAESLEDIVSADVEIPDAKEVATVAGFTEIPAHDKGLGDSVLNIEEESLEDLQNGEGAEDLTDGETKEDVNVTEDAMDNQVLKKTEEEEKPDDVTVLEHQTRPGEVDDVATEVPDKNEAPISSAGKDDYAKEDVEKDPEAGNSVAIDVPEAAEEVETDVNDGAGIEKEGNGMGGVGEVGQEADFEETRKPTEELAKGDETKVDDVSEETETVIRADDMTDLVDDVKTCEDSSVVDVEEGREDHEQMGMTEMTEALEESVEGEADEKRIDEMSEETESRNGGEDQEKDDDIKNVAENVETHGDRNSSEADVEEGKEDHEGKGMTETHEVSVMGKADGAKIAEMSEETDTRTEDEDEEKDENMTDVETHGDSSVADVEEERENQEEMEMTELTDTQEESVMAETGDEEPEEETKSAGGKRKRVRNIKRVKGMGKKKEEDVCFMCFDGGELVLCDRRGCPKAYHPSCVNRDEEFFRSKGKWNCGWHQCNKCEKPATYLCYTCMFSLCKGCAKDSVFFCMRGNKGLCETCMETIKLIEREEQEKKEPAQLDFDDKTSFESLFKQYWIDLKTQLSLGPEELDQAKSPQKGNESHAGKQGTARETDDGTDGGSDSESSPKKRKTRSQSKSASTEKILSPDRRSSGETMEWASKELLDVVAHMRHGDRSFVPRSEVQVLLLDYIKRYKLRDPRHKSQVVCDSRLKNLFEKSHVRHFEMLNLLDTHFLKEQPEADDIQGSIVDTEPDNADADENLDHPLKNGKDKKRKTRKKGVRRGPQSNLDDFAAVDLHNINLIYLRRSLVEDLLEDSPAFEEKVASAFVRLRISGNQKQDLYRLVQVVGTSKSPEPYKVGKKTTDYVLEILNLDKTEVISIDIISNQDFTEDECKRLKQSIKCGLINRLTVGDIQEKAIALQEVRVKNLLEAEILRFGNLCDRASDMGRKKELRECVEKVQLLKSPEERQRRLEEIPEIHDDPKMDPDCESEDEEKEEKQKGKNLRPRSSSFNRRGRDPISPGKGGLSSSESWTSTSNYSNTSASRELSRSYSGRGSTGRRDYLGSSEEKVSESMWISGREKEMQQSLGSEKPRFVEPAPSSSHAVAPPRIVPEISTAPPAVVLQPAPKTNESEKIWHYKDPSGKIQGPFSMVQLRKWNNTGYFPAKLEIWRANESALDSVLLTDALAGLFRKQTPSVENSSYAKARVAAYHGQSTQSEPILGSSARIAPSVLDLPRNSQDTWSSGGSLPSPTPNQIPTPTSKRGNFESRWSPTKPSAQSFPSAQSVPSQASRANIHVVVNPAAAMQLGTHLITTPNSTNISVNHYGSAGPLSSPTPVGGKQSWGNMQTENFDSNGRGRGDAPSSFQNSSASYGTPTPTVLPSQNQPGFPSSDSWRVQAPSQSNNQAQAPANNLHWGMNNSQNTEQPQAPANQNSSWSQGAVNPNMGWPGPQGGMNVNWAGSSGPQGMGHVQVQPQAYPNAGWGVTGQARSQTQVQAPGNSTSSGWMQPGQGMQSGNSNQNWGTQNQAAMSSGGSGGNQTGYWGNQQSQNGDSGYGWNRQSSGNFKVQRVCKFNRENGHCRKGAACNYLHN